MTVPVVQIWPVFVLMFTYFVCMPVRVDQTVRGPIVLMVVMAVCVAMAMVM